MSRALDPGSGEPSSSASSGPGAVRVAVTSRDGVSVNERFHRAIDYFVFEVSHGRIAFVERRVRPLPELRLFRDFSSLAVLLRDCTWVVALGFNPEARRELVARGFRVHEARAPIEDVIRSLAADSLARD
jgi:hypothetical protein